MFKTITPLLALLSALTLPVTTFAACAQIEGNSADNIAKGMADLSGMNNPKLVAHIEPLKVVYARLSKVAHIRPALVVCDDNILNALAKGNGQDGSIVFFLPMLEFLGDNLNEIAAVMGHEFSHLTLDHIALQKKAERNLTSSAIALANNTYRRTRDAKQAVKTAIEFKVLQTLEFSRIVEKEADDKGFSLAVTLGKFSGDGFKNVALKLSHLPASGRPPYLDDHPSWSERLEKADTLTLNQRYLDEAQAIYAQRDWPGLSAHISRWLNAVPESGAAWYYKGRLLLHSGKSIAAVSKAFEDSAIRFTSNRTLGVRSQEDQVEADEVWPYFCMALFDEGYKYESVNCSVNIADEETRKRFQLKTFGSLVIVGGKPLASDSLWVAKNPDGSKLFTNDESVATSRSAYEPVPPAWRPIRSPTQTIK